MNFIDAHFHAWSDDDVRYPLAVVPSLALRPVKLFGPNEVLAQVTPHGCDRVVLIQISFYGTDNRYMLDVIAERPSIFRGVAVVDPRSPEVAAEMRRLRPQGVRGFRIEGLSGDLDAWLDHPGYAEMFACAAAEKMAICPLMKPAGLPALSRMCDCFPETTVVIDHFSLVGGGGVIDPTHVELLTGMSRHPNVNVKLSAFYGLGKAKAPHDDMIPLIRRVFDAFGPARLMWASDGPFQAFRGSYDAGISIVRDRVDFFSPSDRDFIMRKTAERVFFCD